ncbi:MAG TPA: thiol:disulfide interchange protein DsbA/DsbL [Gammaproteobacteria bacterium]|nr:thiol:disulfide interchange protein DsbA/DsbL [Gammaproteobacteria bacterium]
MKRLLCLVLLFIPLFAFAATATKENNSFQAGRDYLVLPANASTKNFDPKGKVSVIEFFSFGCPACFHLNPTLEKWIKDKPAQVEFQRIPVVFESDWHLYARAYYTAKVLGIHNEIAPVMFNALQTEHVDLGTPERMADFFQSHFKTKKADFLNIYESPVVDAQLAKNQVVMNDFMVFQIPGIVIDGKYKVDPSLSGNNPQRLIDTINYLIAKEKHEKKIS